MKKNLNTLNKDIKETLEDLEEQITELLHSNIPDEEKNQIIDEISKTNRRALSTSLLPMKLLNQIEKNISEKKLTSDNNYDDSPSLEQSQKRDNKNKMRLELKRKDSED